ncbi:hypothetical protein BC936DRAFT_150092, partial [Jimgerdemannia flammicorona]
MASQRPQGENIFETGHALIIGTGTDVTGRYSPKYQSTINDAEWLAEVLKNPSLCAYPVRNVTLLLRENTTRQRIVEELEIIRKRISAMDGDERKHTVVVFFSGHGVSDGGKTYLLPFGFKYGDMLATHAIDGDLLYEKLRAIEADRVLLLLNSCYSGGVMPHLDTPAATPLTPRQMKKLLEGNGFAYLSASQASQKAETGHLPRPFSKRYSPFTLGLARGFSGKDKEENDDFLKVSHLIESCIAYVSSKTKDKQIPSFDYSGDNFVVGHYRAGASNGILLLGDDIEFDIDVDNEESEDVFRNYPPAPTIHIQGDGNIYNRQGPTIGGNANGANFG